MVEPISGFSNTPVQAPTHTSFPEALGLTPALVSPCHSHTLKKTLSWVADALAPVSLGSADHQQPPAVTGAKKHPQRWRGGDRWWGVSS